MPETWLKPPETKDFPDSESLHHRLSIKVDGKEIGHVELVYFGRPIRFYYLDSIRVNPEYRGLRFGSRMMESVNKFLDDKGVPGILINVIKEGTKEHGLYERHGWKITSFKEVWVRSKKDLPEDTLRQMVLRFSKWFTRDIKKEAA